MSRREEGKEVESPWWKYGGGVKEEEAKREGEMKRMEKKIGNNWREELLGWGSGGKKEGGVHSCRWMAGEKSERSGGAKRGRRAKGGEASRRWGKREKGKEREDAKAGHSRWKWVWMEKRRRGCRLRLPHTRQVRRRRKMWFLFFFFNIIFSKGEKGKSLFFFNLNFINWSFFSFSNSGSPPVFSPVFLWFTEKVAVDKRRSDPDWTAQQKVFTHFPYLFTKVFDWMCSQVSVMCPNKRKERTKETDRVTLKEPCEAELCATKCTTVRKKQH